MNKETVREVYAAILATDPSNSFDTYERSAEHYSYSLPENARVWPSVGHMVEAVKASGSHYFDADAIRAFRARTDADLFAGRFWVESRKYVNTMTGDSAPREYMVAWVSDYNGHLSIEKLGNFPDLRQARKACARLARAVEEVAA